MNGVTEIGLLLNVDTIKLVSLGVLLNNSSQSEIFRKKLNHLLDKYYLIELYWDLKKKCYKKLRKWESTKQDIERPKALLVSIHQINHLNQIWNNNKENDQIKTFFTLLKQNTCSLKNFSLLSFCGRLWTKSLNNQLCE